MFTLDAHDALVESDLDAVIFKLAEQSHIFDGDLTERFTPADYLASPFNSPDKFLRNEYILTEQQKTITDQILGEYKKQAFSAISLEGAAGTGKSLLLYHAAKEMIKQSNDILIIHGGELNTGHEMLKSRGYKIVPINHLSPLFDDKSVNYGITDDRMLVEEKKHPNAGKIKYSTILIDEAQRIYCQQLDNVLDYAKFNNALCVFCYDSDQVLSVGENAAEKLDSYADMVFRLTTTIRTNKDVADFIKTIMGEKHEAARLSNNTSIVYFNSIVDAQNYIKDKIEGNKWVYIPYTPSIDQYRKPSKFDALLDPRHMTPHEAIGQEFDNVITVIDESFHYDEGGILRSEKFRSSPYLRRNMFFQAATRARQRLEVVVVDNIEVYRRMLSFFEA